MADLIRAPIRPAVQHLQGWLARRGEILNASVDWVVVARSALHCRIEFVTARSIGAEGRELMGKALR